MKKFYDIKKGDQKDCYRGLGLREVSRPSYFWDDENSKVVQRKRGKNRDQNDKLKQVLGRVLIILIILILFLSYILARGYKAYADTDKQSTNAKNHLTNTFEAIDSGDTERALKEAEEATKNIKNIRLALQSWGQDSNYLNFLGQKKSKLTNLETILRSADLSLSTIASTQNQIGRMIKDGVKYTIADDNKDIQVKIIFDQQKLSDFFLGAEKNLKKSEEYLSEIKASPVPGFDINLAKDGIKAIRQSISMTGQIFVNDMAWLTGKSAGSKDILILFQNNTELRGGGGFLGSFAVAHFENGSLTKLDFETNIYKLDKAFSKNNQITSPPELAIINGGNWAMRDSNWALDFSESAKKVKEFYKLESGKSVDGVIALDTTLFTELLKFTGPIDMPEYDLVIDQNNFVKEVQYEVERGYFESGEGKAENEPKKILAEMMPKFLGKFFSAFSDNEKLLPLMSVLSTALKEKHLVFQFNNVDFQNHLSSLNYTGEISRGEGDYLMVSNTNIGGMKSSLKVAEAIKYIVNIESDGRVNSVLNIVRAHNGSMEWPDGVNKDMVRVLVPKGSTVSAFEPGNGNFLPMMDATLAKTPNYDLSTESERAKISFWMNTRPSEISNIAIKYIPSIKIDTNKESFIYNLTIQKQIGSPVDDFELLINYPANFKPVNVTNYDQKNHQIKITDKLNQDKIFKIKFTKN